ncbi:DEAD-box ATP-dependent RNA helicase 22-like protein [Drosera capensis]
MSNRIPACSLDETTMKLRHDSTGSPVDSTQFQEPRLQQRWVEAAESLAKILQTAGIECFCYHRNSSLEEGTNRLGEFQKTGGVLVCTDGLDIPNVSHVIQAVFATSAVKFIHRVGHIARCHGVRFFLTM